MLKRPCFLTAWFCHDLMTSNLSLIILKANCASLTSSVMLTLTLPIRISPHRHLMQSRSTLILSYLKQPFKALQLEHLFIVLSTFLLDELVYKVAFDCLLFYILIMTFAKLVQIQLMYFFLISFVFYFFGRN